ncbi:hypothetical protein MDMS009_1596 [Methylophaga thiooxydans DMS010]|uniref:Uncharacterized protein n=1 Tax=Methylophaga thiooxydans DMS010 TaxID=637616 RepID=C0N5T5_9GAMM|nr:hypothetical protein MDMS009_1596 [Methylophaga thiooxydans DMS010]
MFACTDADIAKPAARTAEKSDFIEVGLDWLMIGFVMLSSRFMIG